MPKDATKPKQQNGAAAFLKLLEEIEVPQHVQLPLKKQRPGEHQ